MIENKMNEQPEIYHKKAFDKITQEKRERILNIAIHEFSSKGYNAASINTIARDSGISIGGMYRYFKSKEALFMSVLDRGYTLLEEALSKVLSGNGDLFDRMEAMLYISVEYARNYREINQIYLDVSTEGLSSLSKRISLKMEGITAKIYHELLTEGKEQGVLRPDIHPGIISFCLDNLVMMMQFAYASDYYMERLKIYTGSDIENEDQLISGIMDFVRHGISG
ncbi:MAG: TetR/AcrR family transcriptional regulator [Spirochaetales bacterium]|nr:TetR/AcrR family transcriptional regulator [Spirochaetales bacterium]